MSSNPSGISYSSELIPALQADHRKLLASYGKMKTALKDGESTKFQNELHEFKSMLISHLLKEAVSLYAYLKQQLKDDALVYDLVKRYKREMDDIGKVVFDFVDQNTSQDAAITDALIIQFNHIGKVLGDRLRREESELYHLYHNEYH